MSSPSTFDIDEFQLEKKDIIRMIESVQKRWRKGGLKNRIYLGFLAAFKNSLHFVDDDIIKFVWRDMVSLTNKMIEFNARKRMMGEMPKTAEMMKMLEDEIESGDFAGEPID